MVIIPINPRVRANNVFGLVDDNPLTAGSVTLNSSGLVNMPQIIAKHATITLDPLRQFGDPEIIIVTTHTASATVATIQRGLYGTLPRQHPQGTLWVHAPLNEDFIQIVTQTTRPSDPYEGQLIYETDTDSYKGHNSVAWEHGLTLGAWTPYTPTLVTVVLGTGGTITGHFTKIGRTVWFRGELVLGTGFTIGTPTIGLPPEPSIAYRSTADLGGGTLHDTGANSYHAINRWISTTTFSLARDGVDGIQSSITATTPFTWVAGDGMTWWGNYETAA